MGPRDGEVDVLICHPMHRLLAVEVKGGDVILDYTTRRFTSIDIATSARSRTRSHKQRAVGMRTCIEAVPSVATAPNERSLSDIALQCPAGQRVDGSGAGLGR